MRAKRWQLFNAIPVQWNTLRISLPLGPNKVATYVDITAPTLRVYGRLRVIFFLEKKSNFKVSKKSHFLHSIRPVSLFMHTDLIRVDHLNILRNSHLSSGWPRQRGVETRNIWMYFETIYKTWCIFSEGSACLDFKLRVAISWNGLTKKWSFFPKENIKYERIFQRDGELEFRERSGS